MDEFLPSEIARLVLGYLKTSTCLKSWQSFFEESSDLQEYSRLFKEGRIYSTNVNGKSLVDILQEYSILKKKENIKNSRKCNCNCNCNCCKIQLGITNKDTNGLDNDVVTLQNHSLPPEIAKTCSNSFINNSAYVSQTKTNSFFSFNGSNPKYKEGFSSKIFNNLGNATNPSDCIEIIELDDDKNNTENNVSEKNDKDVSNASLMNVHTVNDSQTKLSVNLSIEQMTSSSSERNMHNKIDNKLVVENDSNCNSTDSEISIIPDFKIKQEVIDDFTNDTARITTSESENSGSAAKDITRSSNIQEKNTYYNDEKQCSVFDQSIVCNLGLKDQSPAIVNCSSLMNNDTMECDKILKSNKDQQVSDTQQISNLQASLENEKNADLQNDNSSNKMNVEYCNEENGILIPMSNPSEVNSEEGSALPNYPYVFLPALSTDSFSSQNFLQYSVILNSGLNYMAGKNVRIMPKPVTVSKENDAPNQSFNVPFNESSKNTVISPELAEKLKEFVTILPKINNGETSNTMLPRIQIDKVVSQDAPEKEKSSKSHPKKKKSSSKIKMLKRKHDEKDKDEIKKSKKGKELSPIKSHKRSLCFKE